MKSFSPHGRNAVVTGGSRGIGRAIALRLAEVGANVALTYRERADAAHEVAREFEENGRLAVSLHMDVADRASIEAAAKEARRALGPISTAPEVADAVAFLASNAAACITGQTLNVNGGLYS